VNKADIVQNSAITPDFPEAPGVTAAGTAKNTPLLFFA
jgi:hypothetical protein